MSSPSATKLTLVGAGKIGQAIVQLLSSAPEFEVTVLDRDDDALTPLRSRGVRVFEVDITDPIALADYVNGQDMVMSAAPFHATSTIATAARNAGAHYFDLTEDVESTRVVRALPSMPPRRSCRSAGWRLGLCRLRRPSWPDRSTTSARSRCASARFRSSQPTRSSTTSRGRPTV
jgi:saccharopine dehydrogenase-like NADP-dependent oxidoreductase